MPEEHIEEEILEEAPLEPPSKLSEILQKIPWWAISVAFHAVILLILWRVNFSIGGDRRIETYIEARLEKQEEPEYDPDKERDLVRRDMPVTDAELVDVEPVVVTEEVEVDDHFETVDDELTETAKGREDAVGFLDAGGTGSIGTIGLSGGGAGGMFGARTGGKKKAVRRHGGSRATESAVYASLRWLARHQSPDGRWEPQRHEGRLTVDPGITGLALLAFLGAGHTPRRGEFKATVARAAKWITSQQAGDGSIGGAPEFKEHHGGFAYHHAICGLALAELYGMTRDSRIRHPAQKAVDYSVNIHQCKTSGWRYQPGAAADVSVTGWFVMQLKSAKISGLNVPKEGFAGAKSFLDKTEVSGGQFPYLPGGGPAVNTTAMGMLCRLFCGVPPDRLGGGADYLMQNLPQWSRNQGRGNGGCWPFYYWYYATLVNFQMGGKYWKKWNVAMKNTLLPNQIKGHKPGQCNCPNNDDDGSWDPLGPAQFVDRVYTTALGALCLEVYYRYLPLHAR